MSLLSPRPSSQSSSQPSSTSPRSTHRFQHHFPWLYAFWKFSRPHTIIGTSLSAIGLWLIALAETGRWDLGVVALPALAGALLACLCGNVYIVGLNQLEDVEIDQVNKPHLPLASGEFSRSQGLAIVVLSGIAALGLSAVQGVWLMATVWTSLLIGTAYSLPPIRLKRFPVWASLCIFTVRGGIVNLGLFLHFNQSFQGIPGLPATVWALTLFVVVFTFAIAIFKDIPDMEGDRRYQITTFTIRLGAIAVFRLARLVLTACYLGMIWAGFWLPGVNPVFLIATHALLLIALWLRSLQVDLQQKIQVARFYQFIWKLFFLEYVLFPIACLLAT
ncbi:MAG: homogentisate phytyltransferase [Synechococcales cyanobacterium M58_A2018_015]|nr:homogentisate phytyltransferase [Synechococcales cyanobacterium M58_A2018_015]